MAAGVQSLVPAGTGMTAAILSLEPGPQPAKRILYIDSESLTRECVSNYLAIMLPEFEFETTASVERIANEARSISGFLLGIIFNHGKSAAGSRLNVQLSQLAGLAPSLPVMVFSDAGDTHYILREYAPAIRGYVPTTFTAVQAAAAVRHVSAGRTSVPSAPPIRPPTRIPLHCSIDTKAPVCAATFSPRQMQILRCLWKGKTDKTIGSDLCLSPHTVKVHMRQIMRKLDAHSRTTVVILTRTLHDNDGAVFG
jgi:DNA-binding NarL/FixJ family response regulator